MSQLPGALASRSRPHAFITSQTFGAIVAAIVVAIGGIVAAFISVDRDSTPSQPPTTPPSTASTITDPAAGARVPHDVTARGSATLAAGHKEAWLLVEVPAAGLFYPGRSPLALGSGGNWAQTLHVGGADDAPGDPYLLHLVALDGQAAQLFAQYRSREEATGEITGFTRADLDAAGISFLDTNQIVR